ncbi:MAG TPA: DUF4623 domain-containing protein [Verrucomicrobiae bacterium]
MKLVRAAFFLLTIALFPSLRADRVELLWQKAPGDYTWLGGAGSNTERGIAYNPLTKHVLVVSRQAPLGVHILDAETGAEIMSTADPSLPKVLNVTDVAGGTFALNMIGVADDGAIYGANLTTGSTGSAYKIYRWANEDETTVPTIAYEGDPGEGVSLRFGDTFDVRGAGASTQILSGSKTAAQNQVAVFTTTDGENFTSTLLPGAAVSGGSLGVAFGAGQSAYSKLNAGNPLRHLTFDLTAKTVNVTESITLSPTTIGPIGADSVGKYLGVLTIETPAIAKIYDISGGGAALIGQQSFSTANPNLNGVGGVDIGDNKAFFVFPNNGVLALRIVQEVTPVSISTQPAAATVIESGRVTLSVTALGTPPLTYQWTHAGTNLPGQTASTLLLSNATADMAGDYQVIVSNAAGPITSNPATLTVAPIVRGSQLILKWKILPGERAWFADDINTRSIAMNKVTGNVLVVRHVGAVTTEVHVLDGNTGADKYLLNTDPSIVTGGTFFLNGIGVADDGAIYAANLTTDSASSPFIVYRWANDAADTVPEVVYIGDPSNGAGDTRFGDSFDVRGAGETTQVLAGSRNGNIAAIIFPNPDPNFFAATTISVPDAPNGAFGVSVAFGEGNSFYGTSSSALLRLVTYDDPTVGGVITGTIARAYATSEIPTAVAAVAYDASSKSVAGIALEFPDNIRLYKIPDDVSAAPTLLDQELFDIDNNNGNGTAALDFGAGKLVAIDSQNWIAAFDYNPAVVPIELGISIVSIAANGDVTIRVTGVPQTYTVQGTSSLTPPITWSVVGTVTTDASGSGTITDTPPVGQTMRFYRVSF